MSTQVVLKDVRLSYFYAFDGKLNDKGERVWSTSILVPKDSPQVEAILAAVNAAKEKGKENGKLGKGAVRTPLLDGDAKEEGEYKYGGQENRGHYILRAVNYNRAPKIVDGQKQEILDRDEVYSGCYANVALNFYAYNNKSGQGISPGLEAIQKKRDGENLGGGGVDVDEVFGVEDEDELLG